MRGEEFGAGTPLICCHGITATRRYVLHGSRLLERKGFRVISYDARGHGESDPAAAGEGYAYDRLAADLAEVADDRVPEGRFVLAGHSMGAHTVVAYALENPDRVAALVVLGPVYMGLIPDDVLSYWDGLAAALDERGADGFVDYLDEAGIDPEWRETVLRIARERIGLHRHPSALAEAIREVPRSRPFESMDELESIDLPTLVVASRDTADPGHPFAVAEEYAGRIHGATLLSEDEGESPLAWQGGKLSREIAQFCERAEVRGRLAGGEPNGSAQ